MKLVPLTNVSGKRINITQVRNMNFAPGECKKVSPETAKHPAVKRYIGAGLHEGSMEGKDAKVEEPKAPAPAPEKPPVEPPPPVEPIADEPVVEEPTVEEPQASDGTDLRELYLSAPGITDDNVDLVLEKFPTCEELAEASKTQLTKQGVSKSYTSRLKEWASSQ